MSIYIIIIAFNKLLLEFFSQIILFVFSIMIHDRHGYFNSLYIIITIWRGKKISIENRYSHNISSQKYGLIIDCRWIGGLTGWHFCQSVKFNGWTHDISLFDFIMKITATIVLELPSAIDYGFDVKIT